MRRTKDWGVLLIFQTIRGPRVFENGWRLDNLYPWPFGDRAPSPREIHMFSVQKHDTKGACPRNNNEKGGELVSYRSSLRVILSFEVSRVGGGVLNVGYTRVVLRKKSF